MKKVPWIVVLLSSLSVGACGGESADPQAGSGLPASGDFCARVMAQVEAFVAERSAAWERSGERQGGTVVVSGSADLTGLNPITAQDYASVQHIHHVHHMTLIRYDENLEPVPYLAESWEVAEDSSAVTFRLRNDVYWHDGVKTTAEDVAFTYDLMTDPEAAFANASYWDQYAKGPGAVEVVDSFTVRVGMLRPHAEFLDPWRASSIVPRHLLRDVPPAELGQHPFGQRCSVGNGPFVFVEHRAGESWTFAANPGFPEGLGGPPNLDRLVYRVLGEPATALSELLTGGTHVYVQLQPDYADEIQEAPDVRLLRYPHRTYAFVGWNTRRPQLADARVRRALTLGTDREEMVEALQGGFARVAQTTVPPFHWAYEANLGDALAHDPGRARGLLDEAGWRDADGDGVRENDEGVRLSISLKYNSDNVIRRDIAEIMQAQLREIGVEATPTPVEYQTLGGQLTDPERRDFDAVILSFNNDFRMDDRVLFHSASLDQPYGFVGMDAPEMDRLLDTLQTVVERSEAKALWREYQEMLIREQPFTFLYFADFLSAVREGVNGVDMDMRGEWITVREWWLAPAAREEGR
jgi:peptide/nickel transport system substrate-binding protein